MKKRGQATIFIIVAILIVAIVILILMFRGGIKPKAQEVPAEENPGRFLEVCLKDRVEEIERILGEQGGSENPELFISFQFEGEPERKIKYLCYTNQYYDSCVNQEPLLLQGLANEIKTMIQEDVFACFDDLTSNLENKGYSVDATRPRNFEVSLIPNKLRLNINAKIVLSKAGERNTLENFRVETNSELYSLGTVAQEIVFREAEDCYFDHTGYMVFYPEFNVEKTSTLDQSIIYTILEKDSGQRFRFAVRGCVIPPGV